MEQTAKPLIRASIVVIMLFQVAALFSRQYLNRDLVGSGYDATVAKHLSYLVVPIISLVLMWPILSENKGPLRQLLRLPKTWPKMFLAAIGLGFALRIAWWSGVFSLTSLGILETAQPGQAIDLSYYFACPPFNVLILTVIVMAVLTPLTEEIISRGLIFGTMTHRDPRLAVVVSAALFAILHQPSGIPIAFVFGVFAAVQLIHYRYLWAPIITHGTYNLLITLDWDCLHATWLPENPTASTVFFGVAIALVGLTSTAVAIWLAAYFKPGADKLLQVDCQ